MQGDSETVADNVCHLERVFHVVFGSDSLNWETKEAMVYVSIGRSGSPTPSLSLDCATTETGRYSMSGEVGLLRHTQSAN